MEGVTDCMPIYEYICSNCGYREDKLKRAEERDSAHVCPKCDTALTRAFGIAMVKRGPAKRTNAHRVRRGA